MKKTNTLFSKLLHTPNISGPRQFDVDDLTQTNLTRNVCNRVGGLEKGGGWGQGSWGQRS